jgi:hypothetical protein
MKHRLRHLFKKKPIAKQAPPEKEFVLADGRHLKDIKELTMCFLTLDPGIFQHHVNAQFNKNDFAIWIAEVLEDKDLAAKLTPVLDQHQYARIIKDRVKELADFR